MLTILSTVNWRYDAVCVWEMEIYQRFGETRCLQCQGRRWKYESTPLYRHWGSVQAVRSIGGVKVQLFSFMTTAIEVGKESASRPGRSLPLGKTRYPLYRRLGGPQGRAGQVRKISPPSGFDRQTVQPVASRYTDYATWPIWKYETVPKKW